MNDYNGIAWLYDVLAKAIFGGNILKSQQAHIDCIQPNDRILIIGGGSGEILKNLNARGIPMSIDFIEPSWAMIEKAKKRATRLPNLDLTFSESKFESYQTSVKYDIICCFFFLDLFKRSNLIQNINRIYNLIKDDGTLIVSDFQVSSNSHWQRALSELMHVFFRLTTDLESKRLKDIKAVLSDQGFLLREHLVFFSEFIFSATYKKNVGKNGNHS